MKTFPDQFLWGVAAASYQVEGAVHEGGRGPSVWDMFAHTPGKVKMGHTGDVACDHYHRYEEDAQIMADLGAKAYRLSIAWPRILPDGDAINEEGLDFYERLVDALLARGVQPWATLYHWDMPLASFHKGGWLNRDCADWFAKYTEAVAKRLGDRIKHWFTFNEPQCFVALGHVNGEHAPGMRYAQPEVLRTIHHVLLSHGRSVEALREYCQATPQIGWAPCGHVCYPATDGEADIEAARQSMFAGENPHEAMWPFDFSLFSDPAILGHYPEAMLSKRGGDMPRGFEDDLKTINQPIDFHGVNIYHGEPTRAGDDGKPAAVDWPVGGPRTAMNWPMAPEALYWGPKFLGERYGLPMYITENGCAQIDFVHADGQVHDAPRVDFLKRYLWNLRRATADGIDIRGYFQWSILDNFEWAEGYEKRFGIVYVDYTTQKRTPKDSYHFLADVIKSNGAELPDEVAPLF
ncbi:MAG: GH1 family beta-glucosidase [Planctomycetota bacterium]